MRGVCEKLAADSAFFHFLNASSQASAWVGDGNCFRQDACGSDFAVVFAFVAVAAPAPAAVADVLATAIKLNRAHVSGNCNSNNNNYNKTNKKRLH